MKQKMRLLARNIKVKTAERTRMFVVVRLDSNPTPKVSAVAIDIITKQPMPKRLLKLSWRRLKKP